MAKDRRAYQKEYRKSHTAEIKSYAKEYAKNNQLKLQSYKKQWLKDNPDALRSAMLQRDYGITLEEYNLLLQQQEGVCAICHEPETYTNPKSGIIQFLSVDHNHATGKVRKLLCHDCNVGLGYFRDSPLRLNSAAKYLLDHT